MDYHELSNAIAEVLPPETEEQKQRLWKLMRGLRGEDLRQLIEAQKHRSAEYREDRASK